MNTKELLDALQKVALSEPNVKAFDTERLNRTNQDHPLVQARLLGQQGDLNGVLQLLLSVASDERLLGAAASEAFYGAARAGHLNVVDFFCQFKHSEDYCNFILVTAAEQGHLDVLNRVAREMNTPRGGIFYLAGSWGDLGTLKFLFSRLGETDPGQNSLNEALRGALSKRQESAVEYLLTLHQNKHNLPVSILSAAAYPGCKRIFGKILDNLPKKPNRAYNELLFDLARGTDSELLAMILPFTDPKAKGSFALGCAAAFASVKSTELLLPLSGPEGIEPALCAAAERGRRDLVELLLPHYKPALFSFKNPIKRLFGDEIPQNPLTFAVQYGDFELVKLLAATFDPKQQASSALRQACRMERKDMIDFLYPLSDPKKALSVMSRRSEGHKTLYLKSLIMTGVTKTLLEKTVRDIAHDKPAPPKRKM